MRGIEKNDNPRVVKNGDLINSIHTAKRIKDEYEQKFATNFFASNLHLLNYLLFYQPTEFSAENPRRNVIEHCRPDFLLQHSPNEPLSNIYVEITRSSNCFRHKKRQLRVMSQQDEIYTLFNGIDDPNHIDWCFDVLSAIAQGQLEPKLVLPYLKYAISNSQYSIDSIPTEVMPST